MAYHNKRSRGEYERDYSRSYDQRGRGGQERDNHQHVDRRPRKSFKYEDFDAKYPSSTKYAGITNHPHSSAAPPSLVTTSSTYPPPLPELPPHLSQAPFLHASTADHRKNALNYERLEFLGDAYLEVIATRLIYARFPALTVGRQSGLREQLVRNSTLAKFAKLYNFGDRLVSLNLPADSSLKGMEKILADMMEAYLGALVLSGEDTPDSATANGDPTPKGGFQVAEEWMTALWIPMLMEDDPNAVMVENRKDELSRAIGGKFIKIEYLEERHGLNVGASGMQSYTVGLYLTGWGYEKKKLSQGEGINRKEAGMKAAAYFLDNGGQFLEELVEKKRVHDEKRKAEMGEQAKEVTLERPGST